MRRVKFAVLVVFCLICAMSCYVAEAATVTVYGTVTKPDGITPVSNAKIVIGEGVKTVYTGGNGNYVAEVILPNIVEVYINVVAIKAVSLPFMRGSNFMGFYGSLPIDGARYKINIKMREYHNAVFISGNVKDTETGSPLSSNIFAAVSGQVGSWSMGVYKNGYYEGLVNLDASTGIIKLVRQGTGYESKSNIISKATSGAKYTIDFDLKRDINASVIYGTVTDAASGNPIRYAQVNIYYAGMPVGRSSTDYLGRYDCYVGGGNTYTALTTGANTIVLSRSPYGYERHVNAFVDKGKIVRIDFAM